MVSSSLYALIRWLQKATRLPFAFSSLGWTGSASSFVPCTLRASLVAPCWPCSSPSISPSWAAASVGFPPLNLCGYEKIFPFWHSERDVALIGSLQISGLNKTLLKKEQQISCCWNTHITTARAKQADITTLFSFLTSYSSVLWF